MDSTIHGPLADQPARAYGSTVLSLGLLNISVSLYTGTADHRAPSGRSTFVHADDGFHPVGNWPYDKTLSVTDKGLAPDEAAKAGVEPVIVPILHKDAIVKGRDVGDGHVVTISDAELGSFGLDRGISPLTIVKRPTGEAARWLVPTAIYQARVTTLTSGKKRTPNTVGEALFATLLKALEDRDAVAVFPIALRQSGPGHHGMLDCHGRITLLQYSEYLREELPMPEVEVTPENIAAMGDLLDKHLVEEMPVLVDTRAAALDELVSRKLAGEDVVAVAQSPETSTGSVEDILRAALAGS